MQVFYRVEPNASEKRTLTFQGIVPSGTITSDIKSVGLKGMDNDGKSYQNHGQTDHRVVNSVDLEVDCKMKQLLRFGFFVKIRDFFERMFAPTPSVGDLTVTMTMKNGDIVPATPVSNVDYEPEPR